MMTKQEVNMIATDIKTEKISKETSCSDDLVDKMRNVNLNDGDVGLKEISAKLEELSLKKDKPVPVKQEPVEHKPASRTPSEHTCQLQDDSEEDEPTSQTAKEIKKENNDEIESEIKKERNISESDEKDNRIVKRGVPGVTTFYANNSNQHIEAHQLKHHQQFMELPPYMREPPPPFQPVTVTAHQADLYGISRESKETPGFTSLSGDQFAPVLDSLPIDCLQPTFTEAGVFTTQISCMPPDYVAAGQYVHPPTTKTSAKRALEETPLVGIKGIKTADISNRNMNCGGTITEQPAVESLDSLELDKWCKTLNVENEQLGPSERKPVVTNGYCNAADNKSGTTNAVVAPTNYDYQDKAAYVNSPSDSSGYATSPPPPSPFDEAQSPQAITSPASQRTDTSDYGGSPQHITHYPPPTNTHDHVPALQPQPPAYPPVTQNEYPVCKDYVNPPQNTYPLFTDHHPANNHLGLHKGYSEFANHQRNFPVNSTALQTVVNQDPRVIQRSRCKENKQVNEKSTADEFDIAREIILKIDDIDIEYEEDYNEALRAKQLAAAKATAAKLKQQQALQSQVNRAALMSKQGEDFMTDRAGQVMRRPHEVLPNQALVLNGQPTSSYKAMILVPQQPPNYSSSVMHNSAMMPIGLSRDTDPTTVNGHYPRPIRPRPKNDSLSSESGPSSHESSGSSTGGLYYDSLIFPDTSSEVEKQAFWHRVVSEWPLSKLTHIDEDKDTCFHIIAGEEMRNPHLFQACLSRAEREHILKDYVNKRNSQHETALYIAAVMNRPEMVQLMIQYSADPNIPVQRSSQTGRDLYESKTALHYVASMGHDYKAVLKALLSARKVEKNARDSQGHTPLQRAALAHKKVKCRENNQKYVIDSTEIIKELVISGADLSFPDGLSGKTAIHYIIETKCFDLVQATLAVFTGDSCKLLNKCTNDGNTGLHIAAGLQWDDVEMHLKLLRLLMNKGANPTAQNKQNQLPRQTVPLQHRGHQEIINVLTGRQKSRNFHN